MATYTVKKGDTLSKIARDWLGNMALWPQLASYNKIKNPNIIFPGQVLQWPNKPAAPGGSAPAPKPPESVYLPAVPAPAANSPGQAAGAGGFFARNQKTIFLVAGLAGLVWLALSVGKNGESKNED